MHTLEAVLKLLQPFKNLILKTQSKVIHRVNFCSEIIISTTCGKLRKYDCEQGKQIHLSSTGKFAYIVLGCRFTLNNLKDLHKITHIEKQKFPLWN